MVRSLGLLAALLSAEFCGAAPEQRLPADAAGEAADWLFTGINPDMLVKTLEIPAKRVVMGKLGLRLEVGLRPEGLNGSVDVGVYETPEAAQARMAQSARGVSVGPLRGFEAAVGDKSIVWASRAQTNPSIMFCRRNALLRFGWSGDLDAALAFARRLDSLLLESDEAATRGDAVQAPEIRIEAPTEVGIGQRAIIRYSVEGNEPVRCFPVDDPDAEVRKPERVYSWGQPGTYTVELVFGTSNCLVIPKTLTIRVVENPGPATPAPQATGPREWLDGRGALYFVGAPDADWTAPLMGEREWVQLHWGTFGPVQNADELRQQALADLAGTVQDRWLPPSKLISVHEHNVRPAHQMVYYSAFSLQQCNVVCMGAVGKHFLLYIEQPDPLPADQQQLTAQDVLRDEVFQAQTNDQGETTYPRVQFIVRRLHRYRAFKSEGPYEPVNILLADVRLPSHVDLRFLGY